MLYTQEKKLDLAKKEERKQTELPKGAKTRKTRGRVQITPLNMTVQAHSSRFVEEFKRKVETLGTKDFRHLCPTRMTDKEFAARDEKAPGYADAIYKMDWTATGRYKKIVEEERMSFRRRQQRGSQQLMNW